MGGLPVSRKTQNSQVIDLCSYVVKLLLFYLPLIVFSLISEFFEVMLSRHDNYYTITAAAAETAAGSLAKEQQITFISSIKFDERVLNHGKILEIFNISPPYRTWSYRRCM